ncbi:hypothetical protein EDI_346520 [Entamoeba dispar SAW760]|uniref:Transmembrane protein n=1 Tax=Entamoeba dispar (strain ATCC PRA-260 / SAW760) TaxID=370354 RepID=B0EPM0_ENTDS|nr:uncharacterized protein EDI_346520 [Entamoeba dispar SAW760]EDR23528.1 hypothetical protein EDI_346520 [Entamoeba dispar SAW760]|eukprot:EDR23528.1 hypothetical protein EDI_346520 [Entamoeba dispar SAW760]
MQLVHVQFLCFQYQEIIILHILNLSIIVHVIIMKYTNKYILIHCQHIYISLKSTNLKICFNSGFTDVTSCMSDESINILYMSRKIVKNESTNQAKFNIYRKKEPYQRIEFSLTIEQSNEGITLIK